MGETPDREPLARTDSDFQKSLDRSSRYHLGSCGETARRVLAAIAVTGAAISFFLPDPQVLIAIVCLIVVFIVGTGEANIIQGRLQHQRAVTDIIVEFAVERSPGHCAVTYTHATGIPEQRVRASLERLVATRRLQTGQQCNGDNLPYVTTYHLPRQ